MKQFILNRLCDMAVISMSIFIAVWRAYACEDDKEARDDIHELFAKILLSAFRSVYDSENRKRTDGGLKTVDASYLNSVEFYLN